MSVRYQLISAFVKRMGMKQLFSLPAGELLEKARKMNRGRRFRLPKDHKAFYGDRLILDHYHCLTIQRKRECAPKAILYLFGGGMVIGPDQGDVKTARDLAARSGSDCWLPFYPLCTDHYITETYEMVFQCYKEMAGIYGAKQVSVVGFSSGGALAVGIPLHNNALGRPVEMPRQVIACSPGSLPASRGEWERMRQLNGRDILVDIALMKSEREIMTK